MRDILKRVMCSRAAWFVAIGLWTWYAARTWNVGLSEGFSALRIVQVVLATGLAVGCLCAFLVTRARRRRNDEAK